MAAKPFPILFIAPTRIGDAVLTSGLIRRLADEIPHAQFTIVAGPVSAPIFREAPNLQRLIVMEKEKGGAHWFKLWSQVRGRQWGLVLDRRGSGIAGFLRAKKRKVFRRTAGPPVHKVLESAQLLKGAVSEDEPPEPYLYTSPEIEARARELLNLDADPRPLLAMAPAANWVGKTWPVERFARTAVELMGEGGPFANGRLLILGGPEDRRVAESLRRSFPRDRWIDLAGQADLLTAFAALKHARLFIGNDSGLMHLSAAAGAPTLGLFGPSNEELYGPWGANGRSVRGPRSFEQFKLVDPQLNQPVCHMMDLPVETVLGAALTLFKETRRPGDAVEAQAPEPEPGPEMEPEPAPGVEAEAPADPLPPPAPKPKRKRAPRVRKETNG
jgi:ADP-heptose:LPS heptosyltransferase